MESQLVDLTEVGIKGHDEQRKARDSNSSIWNRSIDLLDQSLPRVEIVFFSQLLILLIIIITSLYNLTVYENNHNLWISLLSSSIGYSLPNPSLKTSTKKK